MKVSSKRKLPVNPEDITKIEEELKELKRLKKEKEVKDLKDKDKTYRNAVASGVAGAVVGGLTSGLGHFASKAKSINKSDKLQALKGHLSQVSDENIGKMKAAGIGAVGLGAALTGIGAYKHIKVKRKLKNLEKDDNSEK